MATKQHAQVHRFRDRVALSMPTGETTYLTPADALRLTEALRQCVEDIAARPYVQSRFITTEWTLANE